MGHPSREAGFVLGSTWLLLPSCLNWAAETLLNRLPGILCLCLCLSYAAKHIDFRSIPTMTGNTHMIDRQLDGEWLQARPGESFLIRIPS